MTTHTAEVLHKIDKIADATRATVDKAIDNVKEAASDAANETALLARVAGEKIKEAGENLVKAAE